MVEKLKNLNWEKIIFIVVFITLIGSAIYSLVNVILAPTSPLHIERYEKVKSDYLLMLLQCILGIFIMLLPSMIEKKWRIDIPSYMNIIFVIFLYAAIYLGEIKSFYYHVPHWDTVLHTFSGVMLGALGFSLVTLLNNAEKVKIQLSPLFVAIFAFNFAISLGVLWEVYEFAFDAILGLNMQKFAMENGAPLIGRAALNDTMKDLIVDAIGAFAISLIGFTSMKSKKLWLERFQFKKLDKENTPVNINA